MELQDFKAMVIKGVETNFNKDKELSPMLFVVDHKNGLALMPMPAGSEAQKDLLTTVIIPSVIKQTNAQMIATVNEAWMRTQQADKPVDTSIPVRDHADKVEIVMMTIETKVHTEMVIWEIVRPENKDPYLRLNDKVANSNGAQIKGRYANLLGIKPNPN